MADWKRSQIPLTEVGGLCLASTATLHTLARLQLWLHRPTQEARSDKTPVLAQHAGQGVFSSTENILPESGFSFGTQRMFS